MADEFEYLCNLLDAMQTSVQPAISVSGELVRDRCLSARGHAAICAIHAQIEIVRSEIAASRVDQWNKPAR